MLWRRMRRQEEGGCELDRDNFGKEFGSWTDDHVPLLPFALHVYHVPGRVRFG